MTPTSKSDKHHSFAYRGILKANLKDLIVMVSKSRGFEMASFSWRLSSARQYNFT